MQAMLLNHIAPIATSPLVPSDVPTPTPGPGQVRLRVSCCAVCRTDLHVIEGDLPAPKLPLIPGHQIVGVVDAVGAGGGRLPVGRRVGVAWLRHTCGQCSFCRTGRENLCEGQLFTGYHADGGYAQYALVDEAYAYEIPEGFSDLQAAPLLCAGVVGYRALQRAAVPAGGKLAIYGFGSSAHVIAQIALARGARLYVVTRGEGHRRLARDMGALWAGENPADLPCLVDSAILFAPAGELVPAALGKLEKGGTLALAGIHMSQIPAMDYDTTLFFERDLRSVTANTRADGREFLAEAARAGVRPHVTTYPLADANRALQDVAGDRVNGTAVLTVG